MRCPCRPALAAGLLLTLSFVLSACGGDSGSSAAQNEFLASAQALPADQLTTEQILSGAANTAITSLGDRLSNLQLIVSEAVDELKPDSPVNAMVDGTAGDVFARLNSQNNNLLLSTLNVADSAANVHRSGNTITINPDVQAFCVESDSACLLLMADVTIQVDAVTENKGDIVFLFKSEPLLSIGYAPHDTVYELEFGTLSAALKDFDKLDPSSDSSTLATVTGTARLSAHLLRQQIGNQLAVVSLKIVRPLRVVDDIGETVLSLKPAIIFQVKTNEATDSVTTKISWGALQVAQGISDDSQSNTQFSLGGLTGKLFANESGDNGMKLSSANAGGVPITVTIDSVQSVSLGLDSFGAALDARTNTVSLNSALGLEFAVANLASMIAELPHRFQAVFSASELAGMSLAGQENDLHQN